MKIISLSFREKEGYAKNIVDKIKHFTDNTLTAYSFQKILLVRTVRLFICCFLLLIFHYNNVITNGLISELI